MRGIQKKLAADHVTMTLLKMTMKTFHLTGEADHVLGHCRNKVRMGTEMLKHGKKFNQIRDKFEYDKEMRMRNKALMNMRNATDDQRPPFKYQPFDPLGSIASQRLFHFSFFLLQQFSPFRGGRRSSPGISIGPCQLTLFYNGAFCVYDNVSPEKAQAIMFLVGNGDSKNSTASSAPKAQPPVLRPLPVKVQPPSLPKVQPPSLPKVQPPVLRPLPNLCRTVKLHFYS